LTDLQCLIRNDEKGQLTGKTKRGEHHHHLQMQRLQGRSKIQQMSVQ